MSPEEIYEQLKGRSWLVQGELTIDGFEEHDYEQLYYLILEALAPDIKGNYEYWYNRRRRGYHNFKARNTTTYDFYDPVYEKPLSQQTVREQLGLLKYVCYRKANGVTPENLRRYAK